MGRTLELSAMGGVRPPAEAAIAAAAAREADGFDAVVAIRAGARAGSALA